MMSGASRLLPDDNKAVRDEKDSLVFASSAPYPSLNLSESSNSDEDDGDEEHGDELLVNRPLTSNDVESPMLEPAPLSTAQQHQIDVVIKPSDAATADVQPCKVVLCDVLRSSSAHHVVVVASSGSSDPSHPRAVPCEDGSDTPHHVPARGEDVIDRCCGGDAPASHVPATSPSPVEPKNAKELSCAGSSLGEGVQSSSSGPRGVKRSYSRRKKQKRNSGESSASPSSKDHDTNQIISDDWVNY
jgi:hypothetical protein